MSPRFDRIVAAVPRGARVLDVGCGDGGLLGRLRAERGASGFGLEIDGACVGRAVADGLAVVQGDAEAEMSGYPPGAFDVVVLSNSVQALRAPVPALRQALVIGRRVAVSFPNFGHWRVRASLLFSGRMPTSRALPAAWHATDNIHLCTTADFFDLCAAEGWRVEEAFGVARGRSFALRPGPVGNLRAEEAVYVVSAREAR